MQLLIWKLSYSILFAEQTVHQFIPPAIIFFFLCRHLTMQWNEAQKFMQKFEAMACLVSSYSTKELVYFVISMYCIMNISFCQVMHTT